MTCLRICTKIEKKILFICNNALRVNRSDEFAVFGVDVVGQAEGNGVLVLGRVRSVAGRDPKLTLHQL